MQAMVRPSDRLVLQFGTSLGEIRDDKGAVVPAEIVELSAAQERDLRAAIAAPHSRLFISAAGAVTFDPPDAAPGPTPEEVLAKQRLDDAIAAVRDYLGSRGATPLSAALAAYVDPANAPTGAQTVAALRATIRAQRALALLIWRLFGRDLDKEG